MIAKTASVEVLLGYDEATLRSKLIEFGVPRHLDDGIVLYLLQGIPMGGGLTAVFSNDLMEAFGRADDETSYHMKHICEFIYSVAPNSSHGSPEKVQQYAQEIRKRRLEEASQ